MIKIYSLYSKWLKYILLSISLLVIYNNTDAAQSNFDSEVTYQRANIAFRNTNYEQAKQLYLEVIQHGAISYKLYFNLGNTYFKLKDYTHAILYYEKAALQDPSDEDIRYNLSLARNFIGDKTEEVRPFFLITWYNSVSEFNSSDQWAWWALGCFLCVSLFVIFFFLAGDMHKKKLMLLFSFIFLFAFLASFSFSFYRYKLLKDSIHAIVNQPVVNAKSSPSDDGTDIFIVHEGTKVQMLDSVGEWKEIRIPDGNRGWVLKELLLPI